MKYKTTTVQTAKKEKLLKKGDHIWVKVKVLESDENDIKIKRPEFMGYLSSKTKIRVPIQKPKPINFSEANRVLKYNLSETIIVMTTGHQEDKFVFSGYVLESKNFQKGTCRNDWNVNEYWSDITDTYKNNTNGN